VGEGPDRAAFEKTVDAYKLGAAVRFAGAMPARVAFSLGRILVLPSRAESLPYVVLEAAAAGVPMVATKVGGLSEIVGPDADALVPPGDPAALADAIATAMQDRERRVAAASRLRDRIRASFSIDTMIDGVADAYREALVRRHG
jgi:glycosyltransferase involved in cell wall biosynthesis